MNSTKHPGSLCVAEVDPKAKDPSLFIKVQLQVYVLGKKTAWSSSSMPANSMKVISLVITSQLS